MEQDKKVLLTEQINKIESVLHCLQANFSDLEIDEEVNFISVAKDNLKALVEKL